MTNNKSGFRQRFNCWRSRKYWICAYKALYYGYFGCVPALRLKRYLPSINNRVLLLAKSNGRYIAYYSIPKTGCTTVKSLLLDAIGHPLPASSTMEAVHRITAHHITPGKADNYLRAIRTRKNDFNRLRLLQHQSELDQAFHFTFVRNPWARLASCYANKVLGKRPRRFNAFAGMYPRIRFEQMTFTDFVRFVCRVPADLCEPHFRPQCDFIDMDTIDFIGHTEHFVADLTEIINRAGLDKRLLKWAHVKTNETRNTPHYTELYTTQTRDWVARKYAKDIDQFGYRVGD